MHIRSLICIIIFSCTSLLFAQKGKDGMGSVTTLSTFVNYYTPLASDAASGALSLNVAATGPIGIGDLVMIIQMQGATIVNQNDSTWGSVSSYNSAGLYEFKEVKSVNGGSITLACPIINSYTAAGKVQIIKVPRYTTLLVASGGSITAPAWDGNSGGVVTVEVMGDVTINGTINVIGSGFRSGRYFNKANLPGTTGYANIDSAWGAEKGESIAGYASDYIQFGGNFGRGAPANGGGGGNAHNAGGGGGGNAGLLPYNGNGNPDNSVNNWKLAWEKEYTGFSNSTSSGGGRGGYSFGANNIDPTQVGPGDPQYGGDNRKNIGGRGGRPLDYSNGRLFFGGGGGAGNSNDGVGGIGGNGGGMVFITSCGQINGSGTIVADGTNGKDTRAPGKDAVGGGGAGGTIILNSSAGVSGISLSANGGIGGSQFVSLSESEGPGGGGGGGYIAVSSGSPVRSALGKNNGLTSSPLVTKFTPNGATIGGAGIANGIFVESQPTLLVRDTLICKGNSVTLTAKSSNPNLNSLINWYSTSNKTTLLSKGQTFTTNTLTKDTIFYVSFCANNCSNTVYPVKVNVLNVISEAGLDATICSGVQVQMGLTPVPKNRYRWNTKNNLNNDTIANPIFAAFNNTASTTTYVYILETSLGICKSTDTVTIRVNPFPVAKAGRDSVLCSGGVVQLGVRPDLTGYIYLWSPAAGLSNSAISAPAFQAMNTTAAPVKNIFTLNVSYQGCSSSNTVTVTVKPIPIANASRDTSICPNSTVILGSPKTVNYSYAWSGPGTAVKDTLSTLQIQPANTGTTIVMLKYMVQASLSGCKATAGVNIQVNPTPQAHAGSNASFCQKADLKLGLDSVAGTTYSWSPTTGLDNAAYARPRYVSTNTGNIPTTNNYTLTLTSKNCKSSSSVKITIDPMPVPEAGRDTAVCSNVSVTLGVPSSLNYRYKWISNAVVSNDTIARPITTIANNVSSNSIASFILKTQLYSCVASDTILLTIKPFPKPYAGKDTVLCSGSIFKIGGPATAGYRYKWSTAAPSDTLSTYSNSITNTSTTPVNYKFTLSTFLQGCSKDTTVNVAVKPYPLAKAGPPAAVCSGDLYTLNPYIGPNYQYKWMPSSNLQNSNLPNPVFSASNFTGASKRYHYDLQVSALGCTSTDSVSILVNPYPTFNAGTDTVVCATLNRKLGENTQQGYQYTWSGLPFLTNTAISNPVVNYTNLGNKVDSLIFKVTVKLNNVCPIIKLVHFAVFPKIQATVTQSLKACLGEKIVLKATGGLNYQWSTKETKSQITVNPQTTTTFYVKIENICTVTDSVVVIIKNEEIKKDIYIPNAFTPGEEDDLNKVFKAYGQNVQTLKESIFNRWGELIYTWDGIDNGWDGYFKGELVKHDVYVYIINTQSECDERHTFHGTVTVVR
jgi:gliding motility-associated-like protein